MKLLIFLTFNIILAGCAASKNTTLFLKEQDQDITNLRGDSCIVTGHVIVKSANKEHYRMITSYSNCEVKVDRKMEEFEIKLWLIPSDKRGK
jgi:hypothetical protein